MTLDETIKYYEEKAEAEERNTKLHQRPDRSVKGSGKRYLSCLECAKEHRQLAEWLRELRTLRGMLTCNGCVNEGELMNNSVPCSICKRNKNNRTKFRDYYRNNRGG